jgi:hypothetical protein
MQSPEDGGKKERATGDQWRECNECNRTYQEAGVRTLKS